MLILVRHCAEVDYNDAIIRSYSRVPQIPTILVGNGISMSPCAAGVILNKHVHHTLGKLLRLGVGPTRPIHASHFTGALVQLMIPVQIVVLDVEIFPNLSAG